LLDVRFSPNRDALYIVDFGAMPVDRTGPKPKPGTGVVWRVFREGARPAGPPADLSILKGAG